jgi:hypothetical protein
LPDCDDADRRCGLKRAIGAAKAYYRRGERPPEDIRRLGIAAYNELYRARRNERAAQRRQAAKGGSP